MATHRWPGVALPALVALFAACVPVTVNIHFPQEKIDGAAGRIEDMVRSPENPKPPAATPKSPGSGLSTLVVALAPREAAAQVPELRTQTPELMKRIESRRARFAEIQSWKTRGCIGETNQGFIEARPGPGCGAEAARLVGPENADRTYIYDTLMQQNNMSASDAPRVRAAFARVNRDRAAAGEWVQQDGGQWVKK